MRVAIIPARGGSVRIPRKNIRDFRGKPMMQWPIQAAQTSSLFDLVIVSTDDDEVEEIAFDSGAAVRRRPLSDSVKGTHQIAADVLSDFVHTDTVACVIYPCSPMLSPKDLREAIFWAQATNRMAASWLPTGDAGCYYVGTPHDFAADREPYKVVVDPRRFIDINTEDDWQKAEAMFDALRSNP